jgi:acyl dehydratase
LHGSQEIRLFSPLPVAGSLDVSCEVADIQDKGPGKNAIAILKAAGTDTSSGDVLVETTMTLIIRGAGGFGGEPGARAAPPTFPDRVPDTQIALRTHRDQALIYRLSGDRNPLHSDPWFAVEGGGFPRPILHGLCTYGFAGRVLVSALGGGQVEAIKAAAARFTAPAFPGETLTTSVWRTKPGYAVFRTEATGPYSDNPRIVLDDGVAEYSS